MHSPTTSDKRQEGKIASSMHDTGAPRVTVADPAAPARAKHLTVVITRARGRRRCLLLLFELFLV